MYAQILHICTQTNHTAPMAPCNHCPCKMIDGLHDVRVHACTGAYRCMPSRTPVCVRRPSCTPVCVRKPSCTPVCVRRPSCTPARVRAKLHACPCAQAKLHACLCMQVARLSVCVPICTPARVRRQVHKCTHMPITNECSGVLL